MEASTLVARGPAAPALPGPWALAPCALALLILLPGCKPTDAPEAAPEPIRPVRVVTVEERPGGETVTLTGTVQAQEDVVLAFRIGGQLIERSVNVGDQISTGQVVARLDRSTWSDAVQAARANRAAAMARLVEARNQVERFEPLLPRGFVSRQMFDHRPPGTTPKPLQVLDSTGNRRGQSGESPTSMRSHLPPGILAPRPLSLRQSCSWA